MTLRTFTLFAIASALVLSACLVPRTLAAPVIGHGFTGEWALAWSCGRDGALRNDFREVAGDEAAFPVTWTVIDPAGKAPRLLKFGRDGQVARDMALLSGEEAMGSEDGSVFVAWRPDPSESSWDAFRFFHSESDEPAWEASAPGRPILFSADGRTFVIARTLHGKDRFARSEIDGAGSLRLVGADGEVRGDLPFHPTFSRFTSVGSQLVLLHDRELLVLDRFGALAWNREVPLDHLVVRGGLSNLSVGGDRIAVGGGGDQPAGEGFSEFLHPPRASSLMVFRSDGELLWSRTDSEEHGPRSHLSCELSADGTVLATFHTNPREDVITLHDAAGGEVLWAKTILRRPGTKTLSISPDGELIVLVRGDVKPQVYAWSRDGALEWDGILPFQTRFGRMAGTDLLLLDHHIVRLVTASDLR